MEKVDRLNVPVNPTGTLNPEAFTVIVATLPLATVVMIHGPPGLPVTT